jgi:predicted nuclease of predicted toxin-antitoxin system
MDEHVPSAVTEGLRVRGVDVLTAQEDGREGTPDHDLLERATELGRVLFSEDTDLLREAAQRERLGRPFAGVVHTRARTLDIGRCIDDLELICSCDPEEMVNRVQYLPLK